MTLALLIVRGGPPGGRFDLREDAIIGRVDAGIMLDDDEVSRYHAIVRVHDDGAVIRVGQTELRVVGAHP